MHLAYSVTSSLFEHLPQCTFSRIFENVISKWTKLAIIKTESTTIAFFSSPSFPLLALSFFLLSFSFVTVILELLGLKKPAFWRLFTQMTANFVRLVFKKSVGHIFTR